MVFKRLKIKRFSLALEICNVNFIIKRYFVYDGTCNRDYNYIALIEFFNYHVHSILYFNPRLKFIVKFKLYVMQAARGIFSRIFNGGGCFGCRNDGMSGGFGSGKD